MLDLAFNWKIVGGVLLLLLLTRKKSDASASKPDECDCPAYGSDEYLKQGGMR